MKQFRVLSLTLLLFSLLLSLTGCEDEKLFSNAPGNFDGFVATIAQGRNSQTLVSSTITAESKRALAIRVQSLDKKGYWAINVVAVKADLLKIASTVLPGVQTLKKISKTCFRSDDQKARLCFDGTELAVDLIASPTEACTIVVDRANPKFKRPVYEVPRRYTPDELIERSINENFDSRIEFEHVVQARLKATNASMKLLPHISAGSIFAFAIGGWAGPLYAIGDLAPFLFPTRWMEAKKAGLLAEAEFDTLLLMKADAANSTESLIYVIQRDTKVLEALDKNYVAVTGLIEELNLRENVGLLTPGTSDRAALIVNSLDKVRSTFRHTIRLEHSALAQTVGFFNPDAITGVDLSGIVFDDAQEKMNEYHLTSHALRKSYELHQVDALIDGARWDKKERYIAWIDPSGNSDGSIGLGLDSYIRIGTSQIQELAIKRQKIESIVVQKIHDSVSEIGLSRETMRLALSDTEIQQRHMKRLTVNMSLGISNSGIELISALQDKMKSEIDVINAQFSYLISISKLNRLLYTGPYSRLDPDHGRAQVRASVPINAH